MKRRLRFVAGCGLVAITLIAGLTVSVASAGATPAGVVAMCGLTGVQTGPTTCEYATTGEDSYSVPVGVTSVEITAVGGTGASNIFDIPGGASAAVGSAHIPLTGQTSLWVRVAGNGHPGSSGLGGSPGYNGGGSGGNGDTLGGGAGGGGGASDVRSGEGLEARILVAGGGGGAGGWSVFSQAGAGGAAGSAGESAAFADGGGAGTLTEGGSGVNPGTSGSGGAGENGSAPGTPPGGGGGAGAGFFGGGGGDAGSIGGTSGAGGGGGSSYVTPTAFESSIELDDTGSPAVVIRGIVPAAQTVSFTSSPPVAPVVGDPSYQVSASATSNLPATFSADASSVGCSVAGSTVSLIARGLCVINADQAGDPEWLPAPTVSQSFEVIGLGQSISFPPIPHHSIVDAPFVVSASASSGLAVSFVSQTPGVCTTGGPDGSTVTLVAVGSCRIRAKQTGDATYAPAYAGQRFDVTGLNQQISFAAPANRTILDGPFEVSATASSGLAVSFTSTTESVCTTGGTNGATVTSVAVGTCIMRADQAGDATYNPASPRLRSFQVTRVNQVITFGPLAKRKLSESPATAVATASSGLAVTFTTTTPSVCTAGGTNGEEITLIDVGTCTVVADQAGDATYNPAPSFSRSFRVTVG